MDKLINAYSANSIEPGDVALFVIKAMIHNGRDRRGEPATLFRLYRCPHPMTPGSPTNPAAFGFGGLENEIPQGDRVIGTD